MYFSMSLSVPSVTSTSPSLNSLSSPGMITLAGPSTQTLPIPTPLPRNSLITATLTRLVLPVLPTGTPAVITTISPAFTIPVFLATSTDSSITSSVLSANLEIRGYVPHNRDNFLLTLSF